MHFKARTGEKLADTKLQVALRKLQGNFVRGRADRILELDNFGEIRTAAPPAACSTSNAGGAAT